MCWVVVLVAHLLPSAWPEASALIFGPIHALQEDVGGHLLARLQPCWSFSPSLAGPYLIWSNFDKGFRGNVMPVCGKPVSVNKNAKTWTLVKCASPLLLS